MPHAAYKICRDCSSLAVLGSPYCEAHQTDNRRARDVQERDRTRRATGLKKLYDRAAWRKQTIPFILSRDPLCRLGIVCKGTSASTDVDHIIRAEVYIAQHDGELLAFFDSENLRGACHSCHSRKTMLEQAGVWEETRGGSKSLGTARRRPLVSCARASAK